MMSRNAMTRSLKSLFAHNNAAFQHFARQFPTITARICVETWDYLSNNAIKLMYNWAIRNQYIYGKEQTVKGV